MNRQRIFGIIIVSLVIVVGVYIFWPKNPDLVIKSITHSPSDPTTDNLINFLINVQNDGRGPADSTTITFHVEGGTNPQAFSIPSLKPDQTYTLQHQTQLTLAQEYLITVIIDVGDEVKESDEQNNEKTYEIRVKATYVLKEEAEEIVIDTLAKPSEAPLGMRVYSYPKLLIKGSRIEPYYNWIEEKDGFIICENDCWFFWIDDDPYAQFAHYTRFVIIDAHTKEVTIKDAEWWPVIDDIVVWGTTDERMSDDNIIFEVTRDINLEVDWKHIFPSQAQPGCELWSVIVCGSNDPGNTFEEDTDYIYNVLTGLGYSDNNIFYTSPFTSDLGVDKATNITNVQWAFNQVAANSDSEDKVFIFYSAHGGIDSLQCDPGAPGGGHVSSTDMDDWLDNIAAREVIVLLQGCHTGSFIGAYSDGTIVANENELTGDGETNRIVMTATDTEHSSYGGSSSWGSTFTGGYVESFSDATADVNENSKISVDEAYDYAWDHDNARINGWSFPQRIITSLNPRNTYHVCLEVIDIGVVISGILNDQLTQTIMDNAEQDINDYCDVMNIPYIFEFFVESNSGTAAITLEKIQSFKAMGIDLIIEHGWSGQCQAALSYVNENDMLILCASPAPPYLTYMPSFGTTCDPYQAPAIAEMLWSYGIRACVVIQRGDTISDSLYNVFEVEYELEGGLILERMRFSGESTEFSNMLEQVNILIEQAIDIYGIDHVGIQLLCGDWGGSLRSLAEDYPSLSNVKWFGSDTSAFSWLHASPYLAPPMSDGFADLYDAVYTLTGTRMGYFDALLYDAYWLYALSVIETDSIDVEQVKFALPGVAENYFDNTGWCDLYSGDRANADYDIWGYGIVNGAGSSVRYGYYEGLSGEVIWFTTGISYYSLETSGLNPPGP